LINISLKHHSPTVRKEAEDFFTCLYSKMSDQKLESLLKVKNQKLVDQAK